MRKAITLQYSGTSNATLLYGPEIPYSTQRTNVKAAVQAIVSNSGSGVESFWEIWVKDLTVKNYHAKYGTNVAAPTWSDRSGNKIHNQLG